MIFDKLDIITGIILLVTIIRHASKGFAASAVHLAQWIAIAVLTLLYANPLAQYLTDHTGLEDVLKPVFQNLLLKRVRESGGTTSSLPDFLQSAADSAATAAADHAADVITGIVITILAFLIIYIGIKIVGSILISFFSRSHRGGVIGVVDGILGAAVGIILGIIYVSIIFALLKLTLPLLATDAQTWIETQLKASEFASVFYDHNLVTAFFQSLT